jgi:hypothetical protein
LRHAEEPSTENRVVRTNSASPFLKGHCADG